MNSSHVINTLIHTEKGAVQENVGKYLFWVKKDSTKLQIKQEVEKLYKVHVQKVNTYIMPGKAKRVRTQSGYMTDWKKAVVTLKEGQKIEIK